MENMKETPLGLKIVTALFLVVGIVLLMFSVTSFITTSAISTNEGMEEVSSKGGLSGALNKVESGMKTVVIIASILQFVLSLAYLGVAYFLWQQKNIARYVATLLLIFVFLSFPVGTVVSIVGLYLLWFDEKTKMAFSK